VDEQDEKLPISQTASPVAPVERGEPRLEAGGFAPENGLDF